MKQPQGDGDGNDNNNTVGNIEEDGEVCDALGKQGSDGGRDDEREVNSALNFSLLAVNTNLHGVNIVGNFYVGEVCGGGTQGEGVVNQGLNSSLLSTISNQDGRTYINSIHIEQGKHKEEKDTNKNEYVDDIYRHYIEGWEFHCWLIFQLFTT